MSRRPRLHLRAPRGHAGQRLTATLICDSDRPLEVAQLQVTLRGVAEHGGHQRRFLDLPGRIESAATLGPGRSRLPCHFDLPDWLPPSFDGHRFSITYRIGARVHLDWWPDARADWKIHLSARVETSAGLVAAPGETIESSADLHEDAIADAANIGLQLVSREHPADGEASVGVRHIVAMRARPVLGARLAFATEVPVGVAPSFKSSFGNLSWQLQPMLPGDVQAGAPVPITIVATPGTARARVAARVPDRAIDALWDALATASGLNHHDGRLTGHVAATSVIIRREVSPSRSAAHVEMTFRSLGIGLLVEPRAEVAPRGLRLDPDQNGDDPHYFIDSRVPGQGHFVLSRLAHHLRDLPQVSMTDTSASFWAPDVARKYERMMLLLRALPALAAAIEHVREEVPTPPGAPPLEGWIEIALAINGKVTRGDLSVSGQLRGMAVAVLPKWRLPPSISLVVRPTFTLAAHWHGGHLDPTRLPPEGQAALLRAAGRNCTISVGPRVLVMDDLEVPVDPTTLVPRIEALVNLAEQLRDAPGPFR